MNTTVYLIRHGEVEYQTDTQGKRLIYGVKTPLSDEGKRQIRNLADQFKKEKIVFDVFYTSPYVRAQESTNILRSLMGQLNLKVEKNLHDIWAPGWVGTPIVEIRAIGGDIYSQPLRSDDQETLQQLDTRITTTFQQILKESQGKTIGVIGHGDPTRVLIYRLEHPEGPLPKMSELVRYDYFDKGQAWKLLFDSYNHLIEKELITPDERSVKGERAF